VCLNVGPVGYRNCRLRAETAAPRELTPRELHVWGRFGAGTWKKVRITTDSLSVRGQVTDTTTTETKTTLVRADSHRLTLRIEAAVEVSGKRFESPPQIVEYGYYGEGPNDASESKLVGNSDFTIEGQRFPCQIRQVVANIGPQKQVTKMYLSDDVEPFVLFRETTLVKDDGKSEGDQKTTVEVIAVDMPYKVLHDVKLAAYERTTQKTPRGTNVSLDVTCVDVPGGIVARTSKEIDPDGRMVRSSKLELVDYRAVDDDDDDSSQILTRRQARHARRR
jgi:hypothetical protein